MTIPSSEEREPPLALLLFVPIPGTTKLHRLEENIGATGIQLTDADLREIDEAASHIQPAGERYAPAQMAMVGRDAPEKADA